MDKDKSPALGGGAGGGGLPPHSSRYAAAFGSPSTSFVAMGDPSPSSSSQDAGLSHDLSRMLDTPPRNTGHRRAHSEILSLPDDLTFDSDLGVVGSHEGPSLSDDTEEDFFSMFIDVDKLNSSATSGMPGAESLGMAGATSSSTPLPPLSPNEHLASGSIERPRVRHQHSQSMDGSTSIKPEMLASSGEGPSAVDPKKAMSAAKLADLALVDPKRAKRIWANRQSAARSKERKMRYIAELERKVQTLQTEATTLSAQLTLLQRDTNGLTAENSELKLRLQTMEQQVHLQDALNDALREEVQRLKLATGQMMSNGGPMMNFGPPSFGVNQFYHQNQAMQSLLAAQQLQQLQIRPQPQQQVHPHQPQQQQHPLPVDMRMKGPMTSQNQKGENRSDSNSSHSE